MQNLQRKSSTRDWGKFGEDTAVKLLLSQGYKILERNFSSKFGEIDIVAQDAGTLVFAEVKTRSSNKFGAPEEAVTPKKLYRIQKTAEYYSLIHPELPKKLRIDVVALVVENKNVVSAKIINVV